ncbi:uncharacterized protein LOC122369256 [Amphibalanus amphitrite]|uniref:uncharacterized protein LOC122369256 n=1 Tax=Amphibalanus amphitrite TaxID=1232801 RepID=UPI001C91D15E|nr:uncharacterized protein LOC122369256 [Amphibalanus amphitrite]
MKKFARFWKDRDRSESAGAAAPAPFTDIQRAASPEPRLSYIKHDSRRRSDRFSLRRRRQTRDTPPRRAESCETLYEAPSSPGPRAPTGAESSDRRGGLARGAVGSAEDLCHREETWRRSGSTETLQSGRRSGSGTRLGWSWRWKRGSSSDRSAAAEGPASARAGPPAASLDDFLGSVLSVSATGAERVEAERDPPVSPDQGYRSSGRSTEELHHLAVKTGTERHGERVEEEDVTEATNETRHEVETHEAREMEGGWTQRVRAPPVAAERHDGGAAVGRRSQDEANLDRLPAVGGDSTTDYSDITSGHRDITSGYHDTVAAVRGNEPRSRGSVLGLMLPDDPVCLERTGDASTPLSQRNSVTIPAVQLQTNLTPVRRPSLPRTPRLSATTVVGGGGGGGMYGRADSSPSSDDTVDAVTDDDNDENDDGLSVGADQLRAAQRHCQRVWEAAGAVPGVPAATVPSPGVPVLALRYRPAPPYREHDPLGGTPPVPPPQRDRPPPYQPRSSDCSERVEREEEQAEQEGIGLQVKRPLHEQASEDATPPAADGCPVQREHTVRVGADPSYPTKAGRSAEEDSAYRRLGEQDESRRVTFRVAGKHIVPTRFGPAPESRHMENIAGRLSNVIVNVTLGGRSWFPGCY